MMLSSIKIDFADLGKGIEPIIRVNAVTSDDPRDNLLKTLFQGGHKYLQIEFTDCKHGVTEHNLPKMDKTILLYQPRVDFNWVGIRDNSTGFQDWLRSRKIEFKPDGHVTFVSSEIDLFSLGQEFQQYKESLQRKNSE
jgi:hypothetical protein